MAELLSIRFDRGGSEMVLKKLKNKRYDRTKRRAHEQQAKRSEKGLVARARAALEGGMFPVDNKPLPTNEMEQCLAEFNKVDNNHTPRRSSIKDLEREVDELRRSASKSAKEKA